LKLAYHAILIMDDSRGLNQERQIAED